MSNVAFGTTLYLGGRRGVKREFDRERREKFKSKTFNREKEEEVTFRSGEIGANEVVL